MHPERRKAIEKSNKKWLERSVEKQRETRQRKSHPWKNPSLSCDFQWLIENDDKKS